MAFDRAIEKGQNEITLVNEYRERLIADVVTGNGNLVPRSYLLKRPIAP